MWETHPFSRTKPEYNILVSHVVSSCSLIQQTVLCKSVSSSTASAFLWYSSPFFFMSPFLSLSPHVCSTNIVYCSKSGKGHNKLPEIKETRWVEVLASPTTRLQPLCSPWKFPCRVGTFLFVLPCCDSLLVRGRAF